MSSFWTKRRKLRAVVDGYMELIKATHSCNSGVEVDEGSNASVSYETAANADISESSVECHVQHEPVNLCMAPESDNIHDKSLVGGVILAVDVKQSTDDFLPVLSDSGSDLSSDEEVINESSELQKDLAMWAIDHKLTHAAIGGLLGILRKWFNDLPKDPRTLLHTNTSLISREVAGGSYCHIGIANGISDKISKSSASGSGTVALQVNVDGLPLYKSSSAQLWPILGMVENYRDFELSRECGSPFVIGVFHGHSKPLDLDEYLRDFVDEAKKLQAEGLILNGNKFEFRISAFVCDMPARAFIKSVTGHGGYGGCDKCTQHGKYINSVTFPECNAPLRTDESFRARIDERHHNKKQNSPIITLPIDIISHFPVDYMHLVCLGVMRKLIALWMAGPLATRIGRMSIEEINNKLTGLKANIPVEFQRKPRSLSEYERWKATEFRQFLLYTGCVVLVDSLPKQLYENFMLLSVGIGMLLNPALGHTYSEYSHGVLVSFIKHFGELYGADKISYNVHGLVHLKDDFARFGSLDNISAFPFETFLGKIKRSLRKPNSPLEQVLRRLSEQQNFSASSNVSDNEQLKHEHYDGPVVSGTNYQDRKSVV